MTLNTQWKWRDGLLTFYYGGYLIMMAGWNPGVGVFTPGPSTNEIWISADDGATWTYLGTAPWSARHACGIAVKGTTLYVWGGDPYIPAKDIWTYDLTQGITNLAVGANWLQRTSDWGSVGGDRDLYCYWVYNNKIRMAGGQTGVVTPTMFTDVVELNETTWQWEAVGTLPVSYLSTAVAAVIGTDVYIYGGGRYMNSGHDNFNLNLYKSTNGGSSFTLVGALPAAFDGPMYPGGTAFCGKLWLLNGDGGGVSPGNKVGLWYYLPSVNEWIKYPYTPLSRHATSIPTDGTDNMFIVSGNTRNDVIKIPKLII